MRAYLSLHYPAGNTSCTFTIGDATAYTPVTIAMVNVTSNLANSILTARTDPGDHADTTANTSGIDPAKSVNRSWTLAQGASFTFASYDAAFTFVSGDIDAGANTANFIVGRKSGGLWTYPAVGAKNTTNTTATGMSGFGEFAIGERGMASILVVKSAVAISDPINGITSPKIIPGSVMEYTVIVTNSGPGPADDNSTVLTDAVPANMTMYVDTGSGDPVTFSCSAAPLCGLTFNYGTNVRYTNTFPLPALLAPPNVCGNFTYAPSGSYDANVKGLCINPAGNFYGSGGPPSSQFTIKYRMRIN